MTVMQLYFPSFLFWRAIEGYGVDIVLIAIPHGPPDDPPLPADLHSPSLHGFVRPAVTDVAKHAVPPTNAFRQAAFFLAAEIQDRQGGQPCG